MLYKLTPEELDCIIRLVESEPCSNPSCCEGYIQAECTCDGVHRWGCEGGIRVKCQLCRGTGHPEHTMLLNKLYLLRARTTSRAGTRSTNSTGPK